MRSLAVHQASKRAEKALKSPLPSMGYRVREDHDKGHNKGRPASVWDFPRSVPSKGKERRHEEDEWGDEEEWLEDKEEKYCSWCGEAGHMLEDCPEYDAASDAESTDSSVPLRDWDKEMKEAGFEGLPSVEPFDPDDPDLRACHSTERLPEVPIMVSGAGSLYECERRGMTAYWLWTKADVKAMSDLKFKFSNKMKGRISKLDSRHSASKQNRQILHEIFLSVTEQSLAVKKLWLSVYAGVLRVIPDVKETRHTRDTAQLLTDIAERRVQELPQSMEQARAVSGMVMAHLKGDSETILAADIRTATAVLLSLCRAVYAELKKSEKDKWVSNRNPDSVFKLWHHYMFRGTLVDNEELEQQWARDEQLREKMPPGLTIEEWHVKHMEN